MAGNFYLYRGDVTEHSNLTWNYLWEPTSKKSGENVIYVDTYLSASDYSTNDGGLVRANVNAFREAHPEYQGQLWWSLSGGHGTFGIAVLADVLDESSALYDSEDEALVDAANAIRETIDALEETPYIDEDAHSRHEMELQDGQFPQAMMDVWVWDRTRRAGQSGYTSTFPLMILGVIEDDLYPANVRRFVDADGDALDAYPVEGFQMFYYEAGGNLFSVYPETEGSGDNVTVLFRFDHFIRDFERAFNALKEVCPQAATSFAHRLVEALFNGYQHGDLSYNRSVMSALREGQRISRMSADERAVLTDVVLSNPSKAEDLIEKGKLVETYTAKGALSGRRP